MVAKFSISRCKYKKNIQCNVFYYLFNVCEAAGSRVDVPPNHVVCIHPQEGSELQAQLFDCLDLTAGKSTGPLTAYTTANLVSDTAKQHKKQAVRQSLLSDRAVNLSTSIIIFQLEV